MHVLIHSCFPPLGDHVLGGAQAAFNGLLESFAESQIRVTVVCPSSNGHLLVSHKNLTVIDDMRALENEDPTPADFQHDLRLLEMVGPGADVIVTVDAHYPVPSASPILLLLNNFSYGPETRSAYGLNWDAIVVPSRHQQRCVEWYFGERAWRGAPRPVHVVPYGVQSRYDQDAAGIAAISELIGLPPSAQYLAFPHRPDSDKGFETALRAVVELQRPGRPFILLVPEMPETDAFPNQRSYLEQRRTLVSELGAKDAVLFHPWIRSTQMVSYLQAADWALCPSRLVETFGLTVVESIAAGTPVIATPAGAVPDTMPPGHGVEYIEFDDDRGMVEAILQGSQESHVERGRRRLAQEFTWENCVAKWLDILRAAEKSSARFVPHAPPDGEAAPWLRTLPSGRVWHGYRRCYVQ